MIKINAMGDTCPVPVVKAKDAIKELNGPGEIEVLVDNKIAVQNLFKMANQKGYHASLKELAEGEYQVNLMIGETLSVEHKEEEGACQLTSDTKNIVVAISTDTMGDGNDELGAILMKGFLFALLKQEILPKTILFYNGGVKLTCEGSDSLEDLKALEVEGVTILSCGTCLDFNNLTEKLSVGSVTNMYVIAETLIGADSVIRP